ncbi:MAG: type III-B CRISPR module RAMP protein Cmr6 [Deltaproteobacteria bacterium]|nr:type III-B CRISPR module RAMP protein Cmr6 [Deltaproteobacteria bacterium]
MNLHKSALDLWNIIRDDEDNRRYHKDLHPGLLFYSFFDGDIKDSESKKKHLERMSRQSPASSARYLFEQRKKELQMLNSSGYIVRAWTQKLQRPLASGLGIESALENGITLDHTYGLPVLMGSALKGICQDQYLEDKGVIFQPEERWKVKNSLEFIAVFGLQTPLSDERGFGTEWQEKAIRGRVIFFDAVPVPPRQGEWLPFDGKAGFMNPHYGDYYQNADPPGDYLKTNPIGFPTIKEGTVFLFSVAIRTIPEEIVLKRIPSAEVPKPPPESYSFDPEKSAGETRVLLQSAMQERGAGAKTRVDYGSFGKPDDFPL